MSKKLVQPKYYVYKLTFQSGRTYIGYHKQIKEQDYYITSSTYYERHKQDDPLVNREILIETDDDFKASFLETWCILSDKAYNKETNELNRMFKIVLSHNEYYLYDNFNFYGPYHSIADAEADRHCLNYKRVVHIEQATELLGYKVIVQYLD